MNESPDSNGKGGVNGDFREELMEVLVLGANMATILLDLTKRVYHNHIKPELQYRIKDLLSYPNQIIGEEKK